MHVWSKLGGDPVRLAGLYSSNKETNNSSGLACSVPAYANFRLGKRVQVDVDVACTKDMDRSPKLCTSFVT